MSNVRRYLSNARQSAMESFSNADGFIDQDLSFTGDDFFRADGGMAMGNDIQTSQPYIINNLLYYKIRIKAHQHGAFFFLN